MNGPWTTSCLGETSLWCVALISRGVRVLGAGLVVSVVYTMTRQRCLAAASASTG